MGDIGHGSGCGINPSVASCLAIQPVKNIPSLFLNSWTMVKMVAVFCGRSEFMKLNVSRLSEHNVKYVDKGLRGSGPGILFVLKILIVIIPCGEDKRKILPRHYVNRNTKGCQQE